MPIPIAEQPQIAEAIALYIDTLQGRARNYAQAYWAWLCSPSAGQPSSQPNSAAFGLRYAEAQPITARIAVRIEINRIKELN